jgi:DNA-binding NtrC family response regulator
LNVLVVDPDEGSVLQLKELLARDGHQALAISDPSMALGEIRRGRYQLVVLDVSPGNASGIAALEHVRAFDSDLCVIATTALASVDMAVATMRHPAFHYLQKPLDDEEFAQVLAAAISEKGLLVDLETKLNSAIGSRIREKRKESGLTLKQLANRTSLSVSLISQIELGKSAASLSTLHKLATALQVRMAWFFELI